MKKRILSLLLSVLMIMSIFSCLTVFTSTSASAATTSQKNIVARANYLYNSTWTCKQNVYGWRNQTMFYKGYTYRMPYGQPVYSGYYIGYGVSVDTYQKAAATAGSVFYNYRSNYNGWYSTYYATDCSAYVAWAWGCNRMTTYTIPFSSTNLGYCNTTNVYKLQIGDALNSNGVGHVVLVTGLTYDSNGTLTRVEITEQTPPQLKRSYYTPYQLACAYGAYYTIQRYNGSVPAAPNGATSSNNGNGSGTASSTTATQLH